MLFVDSRWCVSCVWSTATVLLHRLLYSPLQPITGPKAARAPKPHRPGTEHLHPEPRVQCQLLHQPPTHTLDVIFVHGLYGSLGNTWRQGDWRQKYAADPKIVTLINNPDHNNCKCHQNSNKNDKHSETKSSMKNDTKYDKFDGTVVTDAYLSKNNDIYKNGTDLNTDPKSFYNNMTDFHETEISINKINEKLSKKIIPKENDLITEQFYNNTLMDQNEEKYHTQANFVSDMFKKETSCDKSCENIYKHDDNIICNCENNDTNYTDTNKSENKDHKEDNDINIKTENERYKCKYNEVNEFDEWKCKIVMKYEINNQDKSDEDFKDEEDSRHKYNEVNELNECKCKIEKKCEVGCGCLCNDCYSSCWPRDWIREDFPGARIISINYTSDPYLWRPLWIKENKRSNLYERAEQMMEQLLALGVGDKPIVWVGHSKGGLFIKQIYCQAYEAHLKINQNITTQDETKQSNNNKTDEGDKETNEMTAGNIDAIIGHFSHDKVQKYTYDDNFVINNNITRTNNNMEITNKLTKNNIKNKTTNDNNKMNDLKSTNNNYTRRLENVMDNNSCVMNEIVEYENIFENLSANDNLEYTQAVNDNVCNSDIENATKERKERLRNADLENGNGNSELNSSIEVELSHRARLWSSTRGFMFYSVPHRGSPLADIKTPLTARSVDLLEIAKECPLVVSLQTRWMRAVREARVRVRSAVETSRTLMSVLWLRIVSPHSADAGLGSLVGVSVDHREICKPTSRSCPLYTMLTHLIQDAVDTCTHC